MKNDKMVRVRFAPSPTGFLHIGGARTALFNWLFAKKHGGKFILRVEDTDKKRSTSDSEEAIYSSLKWLGLDWDEGPGKNGEYGPYRQSERIELYKKYIKKLLDEKKAYRCFCTPEELEKERKKALEEGKTPVYSGKCLNLTQKEKDMYMLEGRKPSIRFKVPSNKKIVLNDICRGRIEFDTNLTGDFIIEKSDSYPSYNFAVVVDDFLMDISHVIRGDDHITNTPRQIMLYQALDKKVPFFAHIPMILGGDGSRLSKRHGATSVEEYKKEGFLKEVVFNFLSLLGWSPKNDEEIMSTEDIISRFKLKEVSKSPAVFDIEKLKWMNGIYIRNSNLDYIKDCVYPFVNKNKFNVKNDEKFRAIVKVAREYITVLPDINNELNYFFEETVDKTITEEIREVYAESGALAVLTSYIEKIKEIEEHSFDFDNLKKALKETSRECKAKGRGLFMPLRIALTYKTSGPGVYPMLMALGKEASLKRLLEFKKNILEG
ncbi:MAG: glutamate--tRNA ligase [Candidatus Muiribacteriota bacterium]